MMQTKREFFPDGTPIDSWFYEVQAPTLESLGCQYCLTEYGICDDGAVYTEKIQELIDRAAENGGGVIVVPKGTYLSGALFFRQGVHLYLSEGGMLKGSDDVSDYPLCETRIEGESCVYFPALINADGVDGFTICGAGAIDGNGMRSWKAFWIRRKWNRQCTNKDEQRARLLYVSNSSNVTVAGVHLQNSQFWTAHFYKSHHIKVLNCHISSPTEPVRAPSTDAIDIDACTDFLVKGCYMQVNDDSVALKGGKGPWADTAPENGSNERVIIADCEVVRCHGTLTCGSESIHNKNIILRRIRVHDTLNLLWLKMRPDTPQRYEYILVEDVRGDMKNFININPWKQFYDLKGRTEIPLSYADQITIRNCDCDCECFFNVQPDRSQYILSNFELENLNVRAAVDGYSDDRVDGIEKRGVQVVISGKSVL